MPTLLTLGAEIGRWPKQSKDNRKQRQIILYNIIKIMPFSINLRVMVLILLELTQFALPNPIYLL